jgi:site-specific DNA-methyltransferase (adenine-specific)
MSRAWVAPQGVIEHNGPVDPDHDGGWDASQSVSGRRRARAKRTATRTSAFGSGRREGHDASPFYERFVPPQVSDDETINRPDELDVVHCHDARDMSAVAPSSSVALVVTSPPYFAGKEYEQTLGENGVPATYFDYLTLLGDVFAECKRVLEPGGRIAVNVANLGRRPYRSLSADVTSLFQDLGLLVRGEVIWWKGRAAGGSCAWGSFQRPANPVLRDVTERVVIASKGRFDRALKPQERYARGLPSTATISRDEFMEATTDLWELAPESAKRVGHPAPFPVELPQRLIELYTYVDDVVLDPFLGSGTTAVAAVRTGRHYLGFETDGTYAEAARERIATEAERTAAEPLAGRTAANGARPLRVHLPAVADGEGTGWDDDRASGGARASRTDDVAVAVREGRQVTDVAAALLGDCGFADIRRDVKIGGLGIEIDLVATDRTGRDWAFDVSGAFTAGRGGLRRADALWKSMGKASVLHQGLGGELPLILLTTEAPVANTGGGRALRAVTGHGRPVFDVIELLDDEGRQRLTVYASTGVSG